MNISFKLLVFAVVLVSVFQRTALAEAPLPTQTPIIDTQRVMTIPEVIHEMSTTYGVNEKMLSEIIFCESSFKQDVPHDNNAGRGVTGFHRTTFNGWNKKFFDGQLNYNSSYDQIKLMAFVFTQGEEYRDDWTSYIKYVKYGTCNIKEIRLLTNKKQ